MRKLLGQTIVCLALLLPTAVQAVVFDFDGVCGSPPCVIGNLYPTTSPF